MSLQCIIAGKLVTSDNVDEQIDLAAQLLCDLTWQNPITSVVLTIASFEERCSLSISLQASNNLAAKQPNHAGCITRRLHAAQPLRL